MPIGKGVLGKICSDPTCVSAPGGQVVSLNFRAARQVPFSKGAWDEPGFSRGKLGLSFWLQNKGPRSFFAFSKGNFGTCLVFGSPAREWSWFLGLDSWPSTGLTWDCGF